MAFYAEPKAYAYLKLHQHLLAPHAKPNVFFHLKALNSN